MKKMHVVFLFDCQFFNQRESIKKNNNASSVGEEKKGKKKRKKNEKKKKIIVTIATVTSFYTKKIKKNKKQHDIFLNACTSGMLGNQKKRSWWIQFNSEWIPKRYLNFVQDPVLCMIRLEPCTVCP